MHCLIQSKRRTESTYEPIQAAGISTLYPFERLLKLQNFNLCLDPMQIQVSTICEAVDSNHSRANTEWMRRDSDKAGNESGPGQAARQFHSG
jgi:hypothetical protein